MLAASILSPAARASECQPTFAEFLARFESDWDFQLWHVRFPLKMAYVDGAAYPEPALREKLVTRHDYMAKGTIYPNIEVQAERRLEKKIVRAPNGSMVIEFDQPDSDAFSVDYTFTRTLGCWYLTFVDDQSL